MRLSLSLAAEVSAVFLEQREEVCAGLSLFHTTAVEEVLLVCRCRSWSGVSEACDNEWVNQAMEFRE